MSKPIDQERTPFNLAYSCAVENGWESTKELARYMWDQGRASVQPAGGAVPEYGRYTTRCGEMVAGIALRQLGAEKRWVEIRDLNAHAFPGIGANDMYPPGAELIMPAVAPHPVSGEQKPIGKVLSETEMGIGYDRKAGPVVWFGQPSPGFIYSAPPAAQDVAGLVEALEHYAGCGRSGNVARNALAAHRAQQGERP